MRRWIGCCVLLFGTAASHANGMPGKQRIEAGRRLYIAQCAVCHGANGEGQADWDRPNAAGEMPAPPHNREGHTWKHADAMLYRIVRDGWRDPYNKTQRLTMPAFGQTFSPRDVRDVVDYLKTLWTPEQRSFQQEESRQAPFPPEALR